MSSEPRLPSESVPRAAVPREPVLVANEFGSALVSFDDDANDVRLRIEDPRTGRATLLDPFQLQCLAYLTEDDLREIMRPSFQEARVRGPASEGADG